MRYTVGWEAGATAEIEFRSPGTHGNYGLRYNPPFRTTLRSPTEALTAGPAALEHIEDQLRDLARSLQMVSGRGGPGTATVPPVMEKVKEIGEELYTLMLPAHIQSDLNRKPTFIELTVDDDMIALPWEMMHDGTDFIGQKHPIGRFVNLHEATRSNAAHAWDVGADLGSLRVLVIGVPQPMAAGGEAPLSKLSAVEPEVNAIVETLADRGVTTTLLFKENATYNNVRNALKTHHHIIHFSGHATFDAASANLSSLVLYDRKMTTGSIMAFFGRHPAILSFINGCETTRTVPGGEPEEGEVSWKDRFSNYDLAHAFLETGSYLLGSRWRLDDESAKVFAESFYGAMLRDGQPIGRAIATARKATAQASGDENCAWASYVYYGDPRLAFRAAPETPRPAPPEPPPSAEPSAEDPDELATEYEQTRAALPPGARRTAELTRILNRSTALAGSADRQRIRNLYQGSEGGRVVAIGLIKGQPDIEQFDLLFESINHPSSGFEQYVALEAMRPLAPNLDPAQSSALLETLQQLSEQEEFFGTDRYTLANQITTNLRESPEALA